MTQRTLMNKINGQRDRDIETLAIQRRFFTFSANAFGSKLKPKDILPIPELDKTQDKALSDKEMLDRQELAKQELKKLQEQDGRANRK